MTFRGGNLNNKEQPLKTDSLKQNKKRDSFETVNMTTNINDQTEENLDLKHWKYRDLKRIWKEKERFVKALGSLDMKKTSEFNNLKFDKSYNFNANVNNPM